MMDAVRTTKFKEDGEYDAEARPIWSQLVTTRLLVATRITHRARRVRR